MHGLFLITVSSRYFWHFHVKSIRKKKYVTQFMWNLVWNFLTLIVYKIALCGVINKSK